MTDKLLTILTALFGGGWLAQILFMRYEKRKKAAETKDVEIDVADKEDRLRDKKLSDAYDQLVRMQVIIDNERGKWVALAEEISDLKLELLKEKEARKLAENDKCTVEGCKTRTPPR